MPNLRHGRWDSCPRTRRFGRCGFHLREYTVGELAQMFRSAGFRSLKVLVGGRGAHAAVPATIVESLERLLALFPRQFGRTLARRLPLRVILGVKLVASK